MTDRPAEISESRMFFFEREAVTLHDFDATGPILDIGGGGEGVIGQLKGAQVVAIDPSRRELEEAPAGPLKIVMDATDLQFLDETFGVVTAFYTLMYINEAAQRTAVFAEAFRVLTPGGRFVIWDAIVPPRSDPEKDIVVFDLTIKLPEEEIETGYGMLWPEDGRALTGYVQLAEDAGFEVVSRKDQGHHFTLELRKL